MPHKKDLRSLLGGFLSAWNNKSGVRLGFTLTELLIALAVVAVIAVLILPVITTRAQNKTFALSYDTEVKQMLNSLEGLPVSENKNDIKGTMMYVLSDNGNYANNAGAYINKYMKVVKYCGDTPGDCFASKYYLYKDNDRVEFPITGIKGACALLKNGVSICLKPQIKNNLGQQEDIRGWIDLNGPREPNIYGRDLRTFAINLKYQAAWTDEDPTKVIIPDPPSLCQGDNCGEEKDPCKVNPRSEECCKQDGYVAKGSPANPDPCCPWFRDENDPNYAVCYGSPPGCDPNLDPTCQNYCKNHTITGPGDECCAVLASEGKYDPNCCAESDDSDYCCSIQPETEKCCKKRIDNGKLNLTADNVCCKKYQSIYNEYDACKPACEQDSNSEECCNTVERRNKINNPDDQCCRFEGVNGLLDAEAAGNSYNQYCCRLPKNASEQCCKWKYDHIGSSLDFYTKHDYNQNKEVGNYDECCEGNVRGIRFTEGKSDTKSQAVLNRCCTLNQAKSNADEDRLCCDYLVSQKGNSFLKHGQALRRCCKYDNHKNKAECCSHVNDGMAYNTDVPYATQCCMPSSMYNNDVQPDKRCCFDVPNANGESNNIWAGKRWKGCCGYWNDSYNGHKINTESQWQLNCCYLKREKYPSGASGLSAYNANCCTKKTDNRYSWSADDNECCDTLIEQDANNNDSQWWKEHCCKGYLGGTNETTKEYYNTEAPCCYLDGNWTEACCTLAKIDKSSAKWKKNCCDNPTLYGSNKNSVYRENCCDTNENDYTRKNHSADNPSGLNAKNVDLNKHKEYCCHPDAVDPHVECCKLYSSSNNTWNDRDSKPISMDYQIKCCEKSPSAAVTYCPNSCHVRWETSKTYNYDFSRCCKDRALETNQNSVNRTKDVWQQNCCAYAPVAKKGNNDKAYASFEDYRKGCCKSSVDQTFKDGNDGSNQNNINCCIPNGVKASVNGTKTTFSGIVPSEACCRAFSNNGWKDFDDSVSLNDDYKIACCAKHKICADSCEIRSKANRDDDSYNLPSCCKDNDMQTRHKGDKIWQEKCCDGSTSGTSTNNTLNEDDYRTYCCNKAGEQDGNKVGGQDMRCCKNVGASKKLRNQYCCTNVPAGKSGDTKLNEIGYHCDCSTGANTWNVVNKKYLTTCCTDSTVLGRITSNSATKEDWKSKCCSESIVHTSPANNTIRDRHYSYCCNDSGPYSNKSTWLNSTCCKTDNKSSASKSTEGVDWSNVSTVSACCYYHESYPTETCCSAKSSSSSWNNNVSTRDTGYKKSCCDMDNKYCSCGSKLDKGLGTSDTCCDALKTTDNGKSRWQSDCCKYRTSYPSNAKYRDNCCSGDGVNASGNPSTNDTKYCCNPGASAPTKACCQAFQINGWKNWEASPSAISDSYRIYCCQNHEICDSCAIRSKTNNNKGQWNLPNCCWDSTMYSDHKTDTSTWATKCCPQSNAVSKMGNDYKLYCCKPANKSGSSNNTGAIYGTSTLNQAQCCNTYTLYNTCCGNQGLRWDNSSEENTCCNISDSGTFRESCCQYANKGVNASWTSEKFHKTCCDSNNGYCSCLMRKDKSGVALDANVGGVNCCDNLKGSYYNDGNWRNKCCLKYINNQGSVTNYGSNCCTGTGKGYVHGGGSSRTATCCNDSTSTLDDWCCDQNKYNQCSCSRRLTKKLSLTSPLSCCKETSVSYTNAHWISQCCSYSNPGDLSPAKFQEACCKNWGGDASGGGQTTTCCKDNSGVISDFCCNAGFKTQCSCAKRLLDSSLALDVTVGGVNCCDNLKASYYNNDSFGDRCCAKYVDSPSSYTNWASYCCAKTRNSYKSNTNWKNTCCPTPYSNNTGLSANDSGDGDYQKVCCKAYDGTYFGATNGGMSPVCCNTSNKNSSFCCTQKGKAYCTCPLQWTYYKNSFDVECCGDLAASHGSESAWKNRCCTGSGHPTGDTWVNNCCSSDYINSANNSDKVSCCKKLYKAGNKGLFQGYTSACCRALNVGENGYAGSDYYSECRATCNLQSTYNNGSANYKESQFPDAKSCCDSGNGLAQSSWYAYCCGLRKDTDTWTYSGSSYYSAPSNLCCGLRKNGSVYAYIPSKMSDTCGYGGETGRCSDYYSANGGYYCGYPNACKEWRYQNGPQQSGSNFLACCRELRDKNKLSGSYKTACCGDSSSTFWRESGNFCCSSSPTNYTNKISSACCELWYNNGTLKKDQTTIDYCCNHFSDFAANRCNKKQEATTQCVRNYSWNVYTNGGFSGTSYITNLTTTFSGGTCSDDVYVNFSIGDNTGYNPTLVPSGAPPGAVACGNITCNASIVNYRDGSIGPSTCVPKSADTYNCYVPGPKYLQGNGGACYVTIKFKGSNAGSVKNYGNCQSTGSFTEMRYYDKWYLK